MRVSPTGMDMIRSFEGLRLEAYQDAVGVWTIGYGHTASVKRGDVWTRDKAETVLIGEVDDFGERVEALLRVPVTQPQFDALVSLAYNIGLGAFGKSTLVRKLNDHDRVGAAAQFTVWNKAGGELNSGLLVRRTLELLRFAGYA